MVGPQLDLPALSAPLLERDQELAAATAALEAARAGRGCLLSVIAPAGIGKTTLLDVVCEQGITMDMRVLRARADELEHDLAFGVVRALLTATVSAEPDLIATGAARLAGPVLGFDGPAPATGGDPAGAALHGLHWLCVELALRRPLLLVVDDVHWADVASVRFLAYLARRVAELSLMIVVAARPGEPGTDTSTLDALAADGESLHPVGLSLNGASVLVRRRLPAASDELCVACHGATGGNPFLLTELAASLAAEDDPSPGTVANVAPAAVARSVLLRLAHLPDEAVALARSVALFPEGAEFRHVSAIAGLDDVRAANAADLLTEAGVLAAGRPLRFLHPLMRTAVYEDLPPGARAGAHARVVELLLSEAAAPEAVATHALATEPAGREAFVEALAAAADAALAVGAADAAVRYLRRALDEPPPAPLRALVLHRLGLAELLAGVPGADERLVSASAIAGDPALKRDIAFDLGRTLGLMGRPYEGAQVIAAALDECGPGVDREELLRLEAEVLWLLYQDPRGIAEYRERVEGIPPDLPATTEMRRRLLSHKATRWLEEFHPVEEVTDLTRRALTGWTLDSLDGAPSMSFALMTHARCDQIAEAAEMNRRATQECADAGAVVGVPMGHAGQSWVAWLAGDLAEAEAEARTALTVVAEFDAEHPARRWGLAILMKAIAGQGRHQEALALAPAGEIPLVDGQATDLLAARGHVRLQAGELQAAVNDLEQAGRWYAARGEPDVGESWRADCVMALARLGRSDDARGLARQLLADARRIGSSWPLGLALHAAALAEEGAERLGLLGEATAVFERSQAKFFRARALVDYGAMLRRAARRVDARNVLRQGWELAVACGADGLAAYAEDELRASGARRLRRQSLTGAASLTASEERVARLAAEGRTNREIAEELWLTVKTVEMHLSSCYRKLDISSRSELPAALAV